MFILVVKVGKSSDKHCLRSEVEIAECVRRVRDDCWQFFFSDVGEMLRLVGVCWGGVWGDESVEEDFNAVRSLWILSEKKLAYIC